ncbi:MAG: sigma-54 dependent transcriptional regulator [Longimicrobiales bacterium]|nr:sigma-54 dependent transcriptional regulator [Longimicrobiales bacterium]
MSAEVRVLVVDDDVLELRRCVAALDEEPGFRTEGLARSSEAVARLGQDSFDLLVTDLRMPVVDGMDLVRLAAAHNPDLPVLVLTGYPSVDTALAALKAGADDYLTKPVHEAELRTVARRLVEARRVRRENRLLERRLGVSGEGDLVGASPAMVGVLDLVRRLAKSDLDVLVVGDTGTGKELVARRLHALSGRRGRFVPVDCGAIPEALLESELYGHEKGAFTGADRQSMGLLEYASGGTFFLDEVQALTLSLQAKLLRSLQERRFRRVGGTREIQADVRVVAAMNVDPGILVAEGRLREDLYHRLNVGRVDLPPLRERPGDVPLLVEHFLGRYGRSDTGPGPAVSHEAMARLEAYPWPGNVRELQNVIRRALALGSHDLVTSLDLPAALTGATGGPAPDAQAPGDERGNGPDVPPGDFAAARNAVMASFEADFLERALRATRGDVSRAARDAGIGRATFYRLLARHGVEPDRFRPASDDG